MNEVQLRALVGAWSLDGPLVVRPIASGTNNLTHRVEGPGGRYVLRVYQNTRAPARVEYEHAILLGLQRCGLSFRVPVPLPARDGATLVAARAGALAALFPLLPGAPPDRTSPDHLRACGAALAELHGALRRLDVGRPPAETGTYGDLERIHPLVPSPWRLSEQLDLGAPDRDRLARLLDGLRRAVPALYAGLPAQLCHQDYGPGNTLQVGGRTSAVLDFEFAGPDLRAIDVGTGWYWSVGDAWGTCREWPAALAFLEGYTMTAPLTPAEGEAMPLIARLQRTVSLIHWAGRHRAGLASAAPVLVQAQRLLALDRWLEDNGAALSASTGRSASPWSSC